MASGGRLRVLAIQGPTPLPRQLDQLYSLFGKSNVRVVLAQSKLLYWTMTVAFIFLCFLGVGSLVSCYLLLCPWWVRILNFIGVMIIIVMFYILANKAYVYMLVSRARKRASEITKNFDPQIVVGSHLGTVAALQLPQFTNIPMLLFQVSHGRYCRSLIFPKIESFSLGATRSYTVLCHAAKDGAIPLDDAVRLSETSQLGACRLEVLNDGPQLETFTEDDMRELMMDICVKGLEMDPAKAEEQLSAQKEDDKTKSSSLSSSASTATAPPRLSGHVQIYVSSSGEEYDEEGTADDDSDDEVHLLKSKT